MEGRDDDADDDNELNLPTLLGGQPLDLVPPVRPEQHFTQPPPRFTEASLIKALEEAGVGRPSTYAPTMSTIIDRGYVEKIDKRLQPTELGFLVNDMLVQYFTDIVDVGFTAEMEVDLDKVANGEARWVPVVEDFYGPFSATLDTAEKEIEKPELELTGDDCEKCGRPMVWRYSKYGKFQGCSGFPKCRNAIFPKREEVSTGVNCPKCALGTLVEKRNTRRRTIFYGCNRYPDCDFISNDKPVTEPCKLCSAMVVITKAGLKCTGCGNVIPIEQAEREAGQRQPAGATA
jgi:DNA topoisomerase-1